MYKFTNGIVVFDEKTRDLYIKSGMVLIKDKKEQNGESNFSNGIVKEQYSENNKKASKHKK